MSGKPALRYIFARSPLDGRDGNWFIINVPGPGYSFVASIKVRHHGDTGVDQAPRCVAGSSLVAGCMATMCIGKITYVQATRSPGQAICEKEARPCISVDPRRTPA